MKTNKEEAEQLLKKVKSGKLTDKELGEYIKKAPDFLRAFNDVLNAEISKEQETDKQTEDTFRENMKVFSDLLRNADVSDDIKKQIIDTIKQMQSDHTDATKTKEGDNLIFKIILAFLGLLSLIFGGLITLLWKIITNKNDTSTK